MIHQTPITRLRGFSLAELAIVLVIITLLVSGMLVPLNSQRDLEKYTAVQKQLDEIRDALLAYAVINGNLPCPDTTTDPTDAGYGIAEATCSTANFEGRLPWKTLGVREGDAWSSTRSTNGDPFVGFWRYRVDPNFVSPSSIKTNTSTTPAPNALSIVNGNAQTISKADEVIAVVFSTGRNLTADGDNATLDATYQAAEQSGTFDDVLIWISKPVLIGKLLSAGVQVSP